MSVDEAIETQPDRKDKREQARLAMQEYQIVVEDTARIMDRRNSTNTLFVSTINFFFLSAVGSLLYLVAETRFGDWHTLFFCAGILALALMAGVMNRNWLRLSEQNRKLINLRIRYLERLEAFLRDTGYFPTFDTPLKGMDPNKDREYEAPTFPGGEEIHPDAAGVTRRWVNTRGTYSLEEVLYFDPNKRTMFSFSAVEVMFGWIYTWAYFLASMASALAIVGELISYYTGLHFSIGPFQF